jgi:hypothetical protein
MLSNKDHHHLLKQPSKLWVVLSTFAKQWMSCS